MEYFSPLQKHVICFHGLSEALADMALMIQLIVGWAGIGTKLL
jgi:hypothetical protein